MAFNKELCSVYDSIFPVRPLVVDFLSHGLSAHANILDVGCGTGGYSLALSQKGYRATGIDIAEAMIETALEKEQPQSSQFRLMDMLELNSQFAAKSFDLVYCIGNALPNLQSISDIHKALFQFAQVLKDDGKLIVQTVNYDRIPPDQNFKLPLIENSETGLRFEREYLPRVDDLLEFKTELYFQGQSYKNSSLLYPILSEELEEGLVAADFNSWELFGGYDSTPFDSDSPGLIVRASKA